MAGPNMFVNGIINRTGSVPGISQGQTADIPTTGSATGDLYIDDQAGIIYRWSGTAWVAVITGSSGGPISGGPFTINTYPVADGPQSLTDGVIQQDGAGDVHIINSLGVGAFPGVDAIAQLDSTTKGFKVPRMTNAQRAAIAVLGISDGMLVFCTDAPKGFYYYDTTAVAWIRLAGPSVIGGPFTPNTYPVSDPLDPQKLVDGNIGQSGTNVFITTSLQVGAFAIVPGSVLFSVNSTTKGVRIPRMTNAQRLLIVGPVMGLMVFCTDAPAGLYYYNSTLLAWVYMDPGLTIGQAIAGGNINTVLYQDALSTVAEDINFTYDGVALGIKKLKGTSVATLTLLAGAGGAGAVGNIFGSDVGGYVEITAGLAPPVGANVFQLNFSAAFGTAPRSVIISPANAAAYQLGFANGLFVDQGLINNNNFTAGLDLAGVLVAGTLYKWYYQVIE